MPRYEFAKAADAALLDELIAAGFPPATEVGLAAGRCWVTCEPERFDAAAGVVAAHDAAARETAREAEALADRAAGDRLRAAVAGLTDAEAALAAGTVTTIAGLRPILLLVVRVQLAQLRLWLRGR